MRRFLMILVCVILLTTVALGAGQANSIQSAATVASDGSCQVTLIASVHLDSGDEDLKFPLPASAENIKLNNSRAKVSRNENAANVSLENITGGNAGDYTMTFTYTLPSVVAIEEEAGHVMTMPILWGFEYPVEQMEFTVTLPGPFETKPTFSSGYFNESIESSLSYTISGTTISGVLSERLQDHETLSMRLLVPAELFNQSVTSVYKDTPYWIAAGILTVLAAIYWALTMRALPPRRLHCATPPEGVTAGEVGCRLVQQGADLTLMVLTWAQMGYLLLTMDESGRVFLHKRMEMGNERSAFEVHYFRNIFRKKRIVDGTSYRYAQLCRKAAAEKPKVRGDLESASGNPTLFRVLCAGVGLAAGGALGGAMVESFVWRIFLTIVLAIAGAVAAWLIQEWGKCLHMRDKQPMLIAAGCIVVWLVLSLIAGQFGMMLFAVSIQLLAGVASAYGGRRSELGKQTMSEILGLRRYLKTVSKDELQRILKSNPDYYYELAPYALALGVDKAFAKRFERLHQPNCTYLITGIETNRTAEEWYPLLREAVDSLNARQKKLKYEKFMR